MRVAEHALVVDVDEHVALPQHAVSVGGAVGHDVLDLQEVLGGLVGAYYGEAEAMRGLEQRRLDELAAQLVRILREVDVGVRH